MPEPNRAEEQAFYQLLKMAEKSMLERISEVERERGEYHAYIEQWVHEVKTPITALKLLCENNRSPFSREVLAELENINRYTEQALYYARSEHTEKDYSIQEMSLSDVVHGAIADNKYLLRQSNMTITVDELGPVVYADDKWVRFILNQIISNAVKYRVQQKPSLHIFTERSGDDLHHKNQYLLLVHTVFRFNGEDSTEISPINLAEFQVVGPDYTLAAVPELNQLEGFNEVLQGQSLFAITSGKPVEVDIPFFINTGFETGFTLDYISQSNPGLLVTYYPVEKVIYLF